MEKCCCSNHHLSSLSLIHIYMNICRNSTHTTTIFLSVYLYISLHVCKDHILPISSFPTPFGRSDVYMSVVCWPLEFGISVCVNVYTTKTTVPLNYVGYFEHISVPKECATVNWVTFEWIVLTKNAKEKCSFFIDFCLSMEDSNQDFQHDCYIGLDVEQIMIIGGLNSIL